MKKSQLLLCLGAGMPLMLLAMLGEDLAKYFHVHIRVVAAVAVSLSLALFIELMRSLY
jgi:hypothetical protein